MRNLILSFLTIALISAFAFAGNVTGKITDAVTGQPVSNAYIEIFYFAPDSVIAGYTFSADDGSYTISNVPERNYYVNCITPKSGTQFERVTLYNVFIPAAGSTINIPLKRLINSSPVVKGLITDEAMNPISSAKISISDKNGVSNLLSKSDGSFQNDSLKGGSYNVSISADGYNPYSFKTTINKGSIIQVVLKTKSTTAVNSSSDLPTEFNVKPAYPNPFNPTTNISFSIPKSGNVELTVYNMIGQKITTLCNSTFEAGTHNLTVNASNWASGAYLYKISTEMGVRTGKMLLSK